MMKRFTVVLKIWLLVFAACAVAAALCFKKVDVPVALHVWGAGRHFGAVNAAFGATVILTLEAAVVLALVLARLTRGHLSRLGEALGVACIASICAYGVNDQVFKPFFGVSSPLAVVHGARHDFHLAMGTAASSFPSGHMVLAGAFAGAFMRLYPPSTRVLTGLLLLAAALLVAGDWHFVSDVIMGAFVGVSAGMLAGEGWLVHISLRP